MSDATRRLTPVAGRTGSGRVLTVREALLAVGLTPGERVELGGHTAYFRVRREDGARPDARMQLVGRLLDEDSGHEGATAPREAVEGIACVLPQAAALGAELAGRLEADGLLRLTDSVRGAGYRVLLYAPFEGRSLAREIERRGRIEARIALPAFARLARSLARAHEAGLVHGAVTSEHVALGVGREAGTALLTGGGWRGLAERGPGLSPADDLAGLMDALWHAIAGMPLPTEVRATGTLPAPRGSGMDLTPALKVIERGLRLRPENGYYPDGDALAMALDQAVRRLGETKADMTGRFSRDELAGLLQMLEAGRRSGRIELAGDGGGRQGAVAFRDGKIVAARAGPATGREAVSSLLGMDAGRFRVCFGPVTSADAEPPLPISAALLDALRQRDEAR